jgi:hypothetical protein
MPRAAASVAPRLVDTAEPDDGRLPVRRWGICPLLSVDLGDGIAHTVEFAFTR